MKKLCLRNEQIEKKVNILAVIGVVLLLLFFLLPYLLFGEDCVVEIHDNLDQTYAYLKVVRENNYLFQFTEPTNHFDGMSAVYLSNNFNIVSLIFYIFPAFSAYFLTICLSIAIGFFSFFKMSLFFFKPSNKIICMLGAALFSILYGYPYWGIGISAIPLAVILFYKIYTKPSKFLFLYTFLYAFLTEFTSTAIFLCGFWLIGIIILSIRDKRVQTNLIVGLLLLCIGVVIVNIKLFYLRFFINEPLNRDFFAIESPNFFYDLISFFFFGQYHAHTLQWPVLIPVMFLAFCLGLIKHLYSFRLKDKKSMLTRLN